MTSRQGDCSVNADKSRDCQIDMQSKISTVMIIAVGNVNYGKSIAQHTVVMVTLPWTKLPYAWETMIPTEEIAKFGMLEEFSRQAAEY